MHEAVKRVADLHQLLYMSGLWHTMLDLSHVIAKLLVSLLPRIHEEARCTSIQCCHAADRGRLGGRGKALLTMRNWA